MKEEKIYSYKDLIVWQRAMELVTEIYKITEEYPRNEEYGLVSQIRRSAVSIPSNIAEGRMRSTKKDFRQFLFIAYSSGAELETQIEISKRTMVSKKLDFSRIDLLLLETMKMLNVLIGKLK